MTPWTRQLTVCSAIRRAKQSESCPWKMIDQWRYLLNNTTQWAKQPVMLSESYQGKDEPFVEPFGEELETQSKRISDPRSHTPTNTAGNPLWKPSGSERISQSNTARKLLRKQSMKELAIWQDIHWEIRQWTCGECSQPKERVIRWDGHKAILCTNGWETRRCELAWANCPAIHRGIWCSNCGGCPRAEVWGI